ncbi:MAG: N-acyl amino acid synthase FeeM domain-containing protein [Myxococcota bacterium]
MEIDIVRIYCKKRYLRQSFYCKCREDVFKLRYNVYCREMGVVEPNEREEICDRFDSVGNTVIFAARVNDRVVGTIRLDTVES